MTEIEQIKKERDAAIEAALQLASKVRASYRVTRDIDEDIKAVEALKPKPEPLEAWINLYPNGHQAHYSTEKAANLFASATRLRCAHLREVAPAPQWSRWTVSNFASLDVSSTSGWRAMMANIMQSHNDEMERVTGTEGK